MSIVPNADDPRLDCIVRGETVNAWDSRTGQIMFSAKPNAPGQGIFWIMFSPDGKRLAGSCIASGREFGSECGPMEVKMWDAQTGQELFALKGHLGNSIKDMGFSPDGKHLFTSTGVRYPGEI